MHLSGLAGIFVVGNYAYVASFTDDALSVVDVSDPSNPTYGGHIADDGTMELNGASDVYVDGKYAYVAASDDDGVAVIDTSDPNNLTHVASITDTASTALGGAYGIFVSGNYAYVAASEDDGVAVIDISDPNNPTHMGSIFDDDTMALAGARNIFVVGDYAYVTGHDDGGVAMLDVSDPSNPTHVVSIFDDDTMALNSPHGIYVAGNYAYVTGRLVDHGVTVLDLSGIAAPMASFDLAEIGRLQVTEDVKVSNHLSVQGGLNVGTGGAQIGGDLSVLGTLFAPVNVTTITGNTTLDTVQAGVVLVNNASDRTITLPDAAEATGLTFSIKNINTGVVTVTTAGENIDGAASQSLAAQYDFITVVSDGTNWFIISQ
ncbi:MAG: hypothetical protein GY832_31485 [Chloroflexi bacterium]|nr:hypothetical protein [Chloroflexota bacterium]